jgi:putrescine transport system substrate-binding protein
LPTDAFAALTTGQPTMHTKTKHRFFQRGLLACALLLSVALAALPASAQEAKVVNVYNWSDYIAPNTLAEFTRRTGIKVNYDVYDSNDTLEAKILVKKSGYDVVFPSAMPYLARQVKAGIYRKLDLAKIPNAGGVDPKVLQQLKSADPDNAHALPYMMAGTGIGYVKSKVSALLPSAPTDSFALIFEPKNLAALKRCGVTLLDTPDEVFPAALAYIGRDPRSTSEADLKAAGEVVSQARSGYRYFHSSKYINDLANGAICVAHGYAGDLLQARKRAAEAKKGVEIGIFLPREGAMFNIDVMAIPADAPHPDNAHRFIDFLLDPKVVAEITSEVGYANAVPESRQYIAKEINEDPVVYPPPEVKLYTVPMVTSKYERDRNRLWTRIKSGR